MIRNYIDNDWITASIFLSISGLIFIFIYLNQETSFKKFMSQSIEDANNILPIWIVASLIFCSQLTILLSGLIPNIPQWTQEYDLGNFPINKWSFTAVFVIFFYLFRLIFSNIFYLIIRQSDRFKNLIFSISKQLYIGSIILIIFNFINYYTYINKDILLSIISILLIIFNIFKILIYIFNKNNILPKQWYYKLLYICTLQIAPFWAFWLIIFGKI